MNTTIARKILLDAISSSSSFNHFNANTADLEYLSTNGNVSLYYACSNNTSYIGVVSHFLRSKGIEANDSTASEQSLPQSENSKLGEQGKKRIHFLFSVIGDSKLGYLIKLNEVQAEELRLGVPASEVLRKAIMMPTGDL